MISGTGLIKKQQIEVKGSNSAYSLSTEHEEWQISKKEEQTVKKELQKEEDLIKNIAFWNSMAEGRFESILTVCNLFILLMILSLASAKYSQPNPDGLKALGWVTCGLTILCYLFGFIIKTCYIPHQERILKEQSCQWIKIFQKIEFGERKLSNLSIKELFIINQSLEHKNQQLRKLFPEIDLVEISKEVKYALGGKEEINFAMRAGFQEGENKQSNAKWWQSFWQGYVTGKTFSIPGIVMLVFIITPLSNATKDISLSLNNAQGWLAVGFWAACILAFILIKCCLWDSLNEKVENTKMEPLYLYGNVYTKRKELKDLSLSELETLDKLMRTRSDDFVRCFPEAQLSEQQNEVKKAISKLLPKRESEDEEERLREIIRNANALKNTHAVWLGVFNTKIVHTIITSLKFFIVMAITFVENYPDTKQGIRDAQIAVGAVSLCCMGCGYIFYLICGCFLIDFLQEKALSGTAQPFIKFRLAYFGSKSLKSFEVHELQSIGQTIEKRREQFIQCFPKANPENIRSQIEETIQRIKANCRRNESVFDLLKEESKTRKTFQFWNSFADGPLYSICYSCYVELVVLLVTLTSGKKQWSAALGWIGVGIIASLILLVIFVQWRVLPSLNKFWKTHSIKGYSEFNQVYLGKKQLKQVDLSHIETIQVEIETNPVEFKRCFPNVNAEAILNEVKSLIVTKTRQKSLKFETMKDQIEHQVLSFELAACKEALAFWSKLLKERLYPIIPIALVIEILWVQSIATDKYGITVNGFMGVAILSAVALFIVIFKLWYEGYLQAQIKERQLMLRVLDRKRH